MFLLEFYEITHLICSPTFSDVRSRQNVKPTQMFAFLKSVKYPADGIPSRTVGSLRGKEDVPPTNTYYIGWYNVHISISPAGDGKYDNTLVTLKNMLQLRQENSRSNVTLLYLDNKHYYVYLSDHQCTIVFLNLKCFKWEMI